MRRIAKDLYVWDVNNPTALQKQKDSVHSFRYSIHCFPFFEHNLGSEHVSFFLLYVRGLFWEQLYVRGLFKEVLYVRALFWELLYVRSLFWELLYVRALF